MEKNVCGLENIYNKEVWELFKECFKNKKRSKPYISYSDWKGYHFEQLERIKRMTDEDVRVVCGVNPSLLSPDYKEEEEIMESMKDWGKQTYAKDEGEVPFTLEGLYKIWKAIYKENNNKKEKRMKLIIKNNKTGKHYKIEMGGKVKVGDKIMRLNEHEYLYNGRFEYCEVVKVLKKKKKPKTMTYTEFATPIWGLPDANAINRLLESLKQKPGTTIAFSSSPMRKNIGYKIAKEYIEKKALSEFHKRPYFKTTVEEIKGKPQGEENLDKIEFPCYCSYDDSGHILLGQINKGFRLGCIYYQLATVDHQYNDCNIVNENYSLSDLIENWNIEILKGELHLWKEVGEYKKTKE